METFKIFVSFGEHKFEIANDSPDFSPLVDYIVANPKTDSKTVVVTSDNPDFDISALQAAIIDSVVDFEEQIKVDNDNLKNSIDSMPKNESVLSSSDGVIK